MSKTLPWMILIAVVFAFYVIVDYNLGRTIPRTYADTWVSPANQAVSIQSDGTASFTIMSATTPLIASMEDGALCLRFVTGDEFGRDGQLFARCNLSRDKKTLQVNSTLYMRYGR